MKLLVISDIHQRHGIAKKLIDTLEYDKCILLGDYFDNFGDFPADASSTALWLKEEIITNPKIVPLIGNHDVNYFWAGHPSFMCSGYTDAKRDAVRSVLTQSEIESNFKFYHIEDGWMFSHAGLTVPIWKDMKMFSEPHDEKVEPFISYFSRILDHWIQLTYRNIRRYDRVALLEPGYDRGGGQPNGGIIWCDFRNFMSIRGINQFVGHTPNKVPWVHAQYKDGSYTKKTIFELYSSQKRNLLKGAVSVNYNLDTHNKHYAIITDGVPEFYSLIPGTEGQSLREIASSAFVNDSPMSSVEGLGSNIACDVSEEEIRKLLKYLPPIKDL